MEISQKRFSATTRYVFHADRVDYAWKDSSTSRSFSVPYTDITRDRQTLTERNTWFRNVGILWLLIGGIELAMSWSAATSPKGGLWLALGAACCAIYHFRVTGYIILPSDKGNLLVIDDEDGKQIVSEIESRRANQFRTEYDFFPEDDSPQQLRNRFTWLHREGALSDEELQERLGRIEETEAGTATADEAPVERRVLN